MNDAETSQASSVDFFRNFNRVVGAAYLAIVLLTLGFFLHQINEKRKEETVAIAGHVARHAQFIEFVLRSSVDSVESLRMAARGFYAATQRFQDTEPATEVMLRPPLLFKLRENDDGSGFHLDDLPDRDSGGNLTGDGSLWGRDPAFYRDVAMALSLNVTFQTLAFNLPGAVDASFLSKDNFAIRSPWQESAKQRFYPDFYNQPVWKMGVPASNPNREKYWSSAYFGGKEKGVLVTAAAPVYAADSFRGVIMIDTSLDYLNRVNSDFGYKLGTAFLVDAYGAVLAHPDMLTDGLDTKETRSIASVLPAALSGDSTQLTALASNAPTELGGHLVIRHTFVSAPWSLYFVVSERDIWLKLLWERGGAMLSMFLGLTALMVVTYLVTTRDFVSPASKLVQHLALESQFKAPPLPVVPAAWIPWFQSISKAFRESLQLLSIRQELDIAAKMQQAILPRHWPEHPNFSLWGSMRSAKEVGGDFYDHFELPGEKTGIVIADVSGKGVPAALFGMVSKTLLRSTATQAEREPSTVVEMVNDALCMDNDTCMFVTVLLATLDMRTGELYFVNAGHPPPLLIHADGQTEFLPSTGGMALGIAEGLPFDHRQIQLKPGDQLVFYTDGVTEALNPQNDEFTQERLPPLLGRADQSNVKETVHKIIEAVDAFAEGAPQSDDITCLALYFHGERQTA